ncbi:MAG: AMP-binding protein [Rubrivivax sp.]|jgi:fatty-acyl-CoA synthase|nr:AMP-binding protein [Rubrivivax sp.]
MNAADPTRRGRAPVDGLSHVRGDDEPPLSTLTVAQCLDAVVAARPDAEACVFREAGVRWTWRELGEHADRLAAGLLQIGVRRGDRVGIWSPNRSEWILAQYATARIGVVLVNVNPAYRLSELEYALNKVGCSALVTAAAFKSSDYLGMLQTLAPELAQAEPGRLQARALPALRSVIRMGAERTPGMFNLDDVLARADAESVAEARRIGAALDCHDPINIQFTSGTTGAPKGATLTHHNIVNNARDVARTMGYGAGDRLCVPVPLYHCFGMVMSSLATVVTGGTMVFPGEGFDPLATLQAVAAERCTHLHGVPTMFIAQLDHPRFAEFDLSSLRGGIMAGSPCPIEVMKRVDGAMHMTEVTIAYGMTETSPVSFQSSTSDPLERRVSTVGRVMPHLEVKIVDAEGRTVPVGETGELCTRGYSVMRGYWDDEARTAEAVRDGWMHTGDLATIDAEGFCNIVGRVKDMLIRGGENVYPREVEEFLFRHPKVAQVQVFGVPDARYGEEVAAWIVLKPGESATADEIRDFCRDRIAHYKVPRHVRFVAELPMTVTGKAQKFVMRQRMIEELGLSEARTA